MAGVNLKKKLTVAPEITMLQVTEDGKVRIAWTKVPYAEKYAVKRSTTPDAEPEVIHWTKKKAYTDETAEKGNTYWYGIIAFKELEADKLSRKRSAVRAVTVSDTPYEPVISSSAENGGIKLEWDFAEGEEYFIYKGNDFYSRMALAAECDSSTYFDDNVIPGVVYHYCLQAVRTDNGKELYSSFGEKTKCVLLGATEVLSAKATLGKKAVLDIRIVAGADGYIFERSDKRDGEFVEVGRTEDITAVAFEEKLPTRFKNYYYRACAYKKSGDEEFTGPYSPVKAVR